MIHFMDHGSILRIITMDQRGSVESLRLGANPTAADAGWLPRAAVQTAAGLLRESSVLPLLKVER